MRSLLRLALLVPFLSTAGCLITCWFEPLCGGIAATPCEGDLVCIDDPSDDCDPSTGADCSGICVSDEFGCNDDADCGANEFCDFEQVNLVCFYDAECGTCAPKPENELGCGYDGDCGANEFCDFEQVNPICNYDMECGTCAPAEAPTSCGGLAGLACDEGKVCVDDPSDCCDPANGGTDCAGICVTPETPSFCGGFGNIPCEAGFVCVDDPNDNCDLNDGADCGGICQPQPK
jgi:hypothetical protein